MTSPAPATARTCILSSRRLGTGQRYATVVSGQGHGASFLGDTALTGLSGPWTTEGPGLEVWLRDLETGAAWPLNRDHAEFIWKPGLATLRRQLPGLQVELSACVMPDAPAELRRLTLVNQGQDHRTLDVTTAAEVVLHHPVAHAAHPAFARLFIQTERDAATGALLVHRRPRSPEEQWPWLAHACLDARSDGFETDRGRFVGRGARPGLPAALADREPLSGTCGNVLDPVIALRHVVELAPGATVTLTFLMGAFADRDQALTLVARLQDEQAPWHTVATQAQEQALAGPSGATPWSDDLAGAILRGAAGLAAPTALRQQATGDPSVLLRRLGLDPQQPLVVLHAEAADRPVLLGAWDAWQAQGLPIQLALIDDANAVTVMPAPADQPPMPLDHDAATLLRAAAHLLVADRVPAAVPDDDAATPPRPAVPAFATGPTPPRPAVFANRHGGFTANGREYCIDVDATADGRLHLPPRPWTNVLASEGLGCIVSEVGAGTTWAGNSREHRLTPWANDPLADPHGEAFYLRDDDAGWFLSCYPGPAPGRGRYRVRHGHGFTECEHAAGDLQVRARVFVAHDRPVRVDMIEVVNAGTEPRRISLFAYRELVLGDTSASSGRLTTAWSEPDQQTLLARNLAAGPFAGHVTFAAVAASAGQVQHGCSRRGFLGPRGHVANPAALHRPGLGDPDPAPAANLTGDACFAHQVSLTLAPGERASACFVLGQQPDAAQARALAATLATPSACDQAWHDTRAFWRRGLDRLQVTTPSPALDLMVNGWLAYQTLACRMLGRTALYQSGGAFGFRDQLQDSLALLPLWPERTRAQILLHAGHQFVEGDVLHWWHPPGDGGIRTRFADDLLWLPLLTAQYVDATGDAAILAEPAPYLRARLLEPGEDEAFVTPTLAGEQGDLYDHCCRALDRSLATGAHGLPLFGTGDWNDGMNRVGRLGRGESVWMGFFLVSAIDAFAPFCDQRGDHDRAARYRAHRDRLAAALDDGGWDGQWYLRGYYDDGTPLGSHTGDECRIDALVQAWSVLSGVASPARREQVLDMVDRHLIAEDQGLIRLLTPPFVDTPHDPGYIKGYVAGVRENGGQYTHAALWVVQAMAAAGRRHRAAALLDLLNPVLHAVTDADIARYQVEPYVVAADVYGAEPHIGRGGWTWYTGSSGWMLRAALESVLGLTTPGGDTLQLAPCVPDTWPGFSLSWCEPVADTTYDIVVTNPHGCAAAVVAITLDGEPHDPVDGVCRLPLARDGGRHQVQVELGRATNPEDVQR